MNFEITGIKFTWHHQTDTARRSKGKKGDRRWSVDGLPTMRRLLDEGKKANKDFEFHLQCLLDFYSKYYMFGEVGVFLLDKNGK